MKIEKSELLFDTNYKYQEKKETSTEFEVLFGQFHKENTKEAGGAEPALGAVQAPAATQAQNPLSAFALNQSSMNQSSADQSMNSIEAQSMAFSVRLFMLNARMNALPIVGSDGFNGSSLSKLLGDFSGASLGEAGQEGFRLSMSIRMRQTEFYQETERSSFAANGSVTNAQGKSFDVSHAFDMYRHYETTETMEMTMKRPFKDPLVLNFNNESVKMSDVTIDFDMDADGEMDLMRFTAGGSGFLALDKNGDGVINDGTELFGALSGDGFKDLSAYDEDGNGFIDEGDSVFSQLQVWHLDGENNPTLMDLKAADVGAIGLQSAITPFTVTNENNEAEAYVRQTGIALSDSGEVKTLQQIDIVL